MRAHSILSAFCFFPLPLILLAACNGNNDSDTSGGDADTDSDTDSDTDTGAAVTISSPADSSAIYLSDGGTLTWTVTGLTLDADHIGAEVVEGEGHVHVYLDNEYMAATAETSYTYESLTAGEHTFGVRLAENDHTETNINATDEVSVLVLDPSVAITAPTDGSSLAVSSTSLNLTIADFTISEDVGGAAAVGEGHYHIYVDGLYFDYGTSLTDALVPRLSEGEHAITVKLANSEHIEIGVETSVDVTVESGAQYVAIDGSPYVNEYGSATVPLVVSVENFAFGSAAGYYVYLDNVMVADSTTPEITLRHVAAGNHWVEVRLHDQAGVETGARDYIRLDVADDARDISITSPTDGENITGDFNLVATAANYLFDPAAVGGTNAEGTGHFHVYVDGIYWTFGSGSTTVSGLTRGDHEILVELVNNDHSTASPTASDVIYVTVN